MDQPLKKTPRKVYTEPTLQTYGRLVEVAEGTSVGRLTTTGTPPG